LELKEAGVILDHFFAMGRIGFIINYHGRPLAIYRSKSGTDGKEAGSWSVFLGFGYGTGMGGHGLDAAFSSFV